VREKSEVFYSHVRIARNHVELLVQPLSSDNQSPPELVSSLPALVVYTLKSETAHDALSMLTISGLDKSRILYVHMAMSYVICSFLLSFAHRCRSSRVDLSSSPLS